MGNKNFKILIVIFLITGSLYFIFIGLIRGMGFLVPLVTAVILAMVVAPVAEKFRNWGVKKVWAVLLADLVVVLFIAFMVFLLAAQANQVASNWSEIEKRLKPKLEQADSYFQDKLNMSIPLGGQEQESRQQKQDQDDSENQKPKEEEQSQKNNDTEKTNQSGDSGQKKETANDESKSRDSSQSSFDTESIRSQLTGIVKNIFSFISNLLLILIYIFFFLFYSQKFRNSILGMVKEEQKEGTEEILDKITKTAQQYLLGRFFLILVLAVLYMVGWSILGLKYALFISLIAALFSLIPYVGNFLGLVLAIAMSFLSGDDSGGIGQMIAIFAVFGIVQFIESYILEPYIVGNKVDVNPVVVIVGVVLGGMVWGVMGMILSIPLIAIIKVIFNHIESLRPLGYALDERDVSSDNGKEDKIKEWLKNKARKMGLKKS
ncbi:MAG: AI-2E family transporter [Bacteroidota bacterium]